MAQEIHGRNRELELTESNLKKEEIVKAKAVEKDRSEEPCVESAYYDKGNDLIVI